MASLYRATAIVRIANADAADVVVVEDGAGTIVVIARARSGRSGTVSPSHRPRRHATHFVRLPPRHRQPLRSKRQLQSVRHPTSDIRPPVIPSALVASA